MFYISFLPNKNAGAIPASDKHIEDELEKSVNLKQDKFVVVCLIRVTT